MEKHLIPEAGHLLGFGKMATLRQSSTSASRGSRPTSMVGGDSSSTMTLGSEDRIMTWCSALNIYKVVSHFSLSYLCNMLKGKVCSSSLRLISIFHCVITIYVLLSILCSIMYKTLAHFKLLCSNYKRFIRQRYWSIIRIIDNINY